MCVDGVDSYQCVCNPNFIRNENSCVQLPVTQKEAQGYYYASKQNKKKKTGPHHPCPFNTLFQVENAERGHNGEGTIHKR